MDQIVRRRTAGGDQGETSPGRASAGAADGSVGGGAGGSAGGVVGGTTAGPGRKRGKALEAAIFDAALDQLTSGGFARMTMEGVAGAAQTGKAALYRRWASKADLVLDALGSTLPPPVDIPDLGSVRAELMQLMAYFGDALDSRAGTAMRALMAELDHERARVFQDFIMDRVIRPAALATMQILQRGELRGDVRPGAATPLVADVGPAMLLYRAKICQGRLDADFGQALVDEVLLPMVSPAERR